MDLSRVLGGWSMGDMEFTIVEGSSGLMIHHPAAPEDFSSYLDRIGADLYVIRGGQFHGAQVAFFIDDTGSTTGTVGGAPMLTRLDRPGEPPPGSGLTAASPELDHEIESGFAAVVEDLRRAPDGRNVDDLLPTPPAPFVQWLMERDEFIFHGSNRRDIDEFHPVRASMEIRDTGGRGNLGAVYGTHDGIWSMFFAVVDRQRLRGSIRNGVTRYDSGDRSIDMYHFSMHHEVLVEAPFTTGALYLLPRRAFERLPFYPGGPLSNEWACHDPVKPIARLTIEPDDFPFLDDIGGHDDGPLIRLGELGDEIYGRLVSATRNEQGFEIVTQADASLVAQFIELSSQLYPDVERAATQTGGGVVISMTGPPAFMDSMSQKLAPHLS